MKWVSAGLLLLFVAFALQLHFIIWTVVLVAVIWHLARRITKTWSENLHAERSCDVLEAEVGDRREFSIEFENKGKWPILWALCEELTPRLPPGQEKNSLIMQGEHAAVIQMASGSKTKWDYSVSFRRRGYYQFGPLVMETGDVFGMDRRFRVLCPPVWILVRPRIKLLSGYDIQSRRPIGEIVMTHRLFEDPTRTAGVRKYQAGDPLNRVHWRASARVGSLQSRVFESSSLAGATLVLDFHIDSYEPDHEPVRSELAITAAASISNLLYEMNQQSGLLSNGRDAADRIREEGWQGDSRTRGQSRQGVTMADKTDRLLPVLIPPSRSPERLHQILDQLARLELTDGLTLDQTLLGSTGRLPRDATIIAIVSKMNEPAAFALESLKRQGYAVVAIVNRWDDDEFLVASSFLAARSIEVHHLKQEDSISGICKRLAVGR